MSLSQNQFALSTLKGTLDHGRSLTCRFHSSDAAALLESGEFVELADVVAGVAPAVPCVKKAADKEGKYFGVVLTNPLKDQFAVGEKLEVGYLGCVVVVETSGAVALGASLAYDPATKKVAAAGASDTVVGLALEKASSAGLIRALINTKF